MSALSTHSTPHTGTGVEEEGGRRKMEEKLISMIKGDKSTKRSLQQAKAKGIDPPSQGQRLDAIDSSRHDP